MGEGFKVRLFLLVVSIYGIGLEFAYTADQMGPLYDRSQRLVGEFHRLEWIEIVPEISLLDRSYWY